MSAEIHEERRRSGWRAFLRRVGDDRFLLRLVVLAQGIYSWTTALFIPSSLQARLVMESDAGDALMVVMPVFIVALVADLVINDLMPNRYSWRAAWRHRHWVYFGFTTYWMLQVFVAAGVERFGLLASYYLLYAAFTMILAAKDKLTEVRDGDQ